MSASTHSRQAGVMQSPTSPFILRSDSLMGMPANNQKRNVSLQVLNTDDAVSRIVYEVDVPTASVSKENQAGVKRQRSGERKTPPELMFVQQSLTMLLARLTILIQRSSGRDKISALIQYGSLALSDVLEGDAAVVWDGVEDTVSKARKVFRLFKWIKELERARLSSHLVEDYGLFKVAIKVLSHIFAALYYAADNVIWAAQVGLINRPELPAGGAVRDLLFNRISMDKFYDVQQKHRKVVQLRESAEARIQTFKDLKNWFSLTRLVFGIMHSGLQLRTLYSEERRLKERYRARIARVRASTGIDPSIPLDSSSAASSSEDEDSRGRERNGNEKNAAESGDGGGWAVGDDITARDTETMATLPEEREEGGNEAAGRLRPARPSVEEQLLRRQRKERLSRLHASLIVYWRDLCTSSCNFLILCKWLKIGPMRHIPVWGAGLLGVLNALIGLHKNWPRETKKSKGSSGSGGTRKPL